MAKKSITKRIGSKPERRPDIHEIVVEKFRRDTAVHSANPISSFRPPRRPGYARIYFRRVVRLPWTIVHAVEYIFQYAAISVAAEYLLWRTIDRQVRSEQLRIDFFLL